MMYKSKDQQYSGPVAYRASLSSRLTAGSLALLSIWLATMAAINGVPDDIGYAEALFLPTLYMTIGLLVPVALQVRSDLKAVLHIENLLMVGLVYWLLLDMLQSAYIFQFTTSENVRWAFGMVGAFASALWIGAMGRGWALPRAIASITDRELTARMLYNATLIAFVLGMAKYVIGSNFDPELLIEGLVGGRWTAPWARGELGDASAFLDHLQYFGYIMPSMCVLIANRIGWAHWRLLIALVLSAIVLAFLAQSGGRRIIGVAIGAAIFTWVAATPRLRPRMIFGASVITVALLIFMQEMLYYRNVGFSGVGEWMSTQARVTHLHVDDNFLRLSQLILIYPDIREFALLEPLFHALTLPIPRVFWPGKPLGPGFDLAGMLGMRGISLSSSIIGELYVSYGILAVLAGGWVMGRIAGMWNKILQSPTGGNRPLMYALGLMALFAGLRSMQALVQISYIVLAWVFVSSLVSRSASSADTGQPVRD